MEVIDEMHALEGKDYFKKKLCIKQIFFHLLLFFLSF